MIQDAHPVRSGVPDLYEALYKIDITVAATTWVVNSDRLPSGFGAGSNVFSATGIGLLVFPAGQRVRGASASVTTPGATAAEQRDAAVAVINETAGTATLVITDRATPALANPVVNSIVWVRLSLETI